MSEDVHSRLFPCHFSPFSHIYLISVPAIFLRPDTNPHVQQSPPALLPVLAGPLLLPPWLHPGGPRPPSRLCGSTPHLPLAQRVCSQMTSRRGRPRTPGPRGGV